MKKIPVLICLVSLFSSCSKDYLFKRDQVALSKELHAINNADQIVRKFAFFPDEKYKIRTAGFVFDSLTKVNFNYSGTFDYSKIPSTESQLKKLPKTTVEAYKSEVRDVIKLGMYIDRIHEDKMLKIIKKYGYPSFENRKWIDSVKTGNIISVVLSHFDYRSKKGKEILKLMIKEYTKGRVSEGEMKHFLWNVDGRNGYPYEYVINIEDWKKRAYVE